MTLHSNHNIFLPKSCGSPVHDVAEHISHLGLGRLDFEHYAVAGDVIYSVEGDLISTSQQDEEARIATLAYALKKLGNPENAAEFMRCLNTICEEGDARYRQIVASYNYGEIAERGASVVLKEMALIAMQLASLNSVEERTEDGSEAAYDIRSSSCSGHPIFDHEIRSVERMIRTRRKASRLPQDGHGEWLEFLLSAGVSCEELHDVIDPAEAMDQYCENGAIIRMSANERTVACGRVDREITAGDLPERARFLAGDLIRAYISGAEIEEIWDDINAQLNILYPVKGGTENGRFFSWANIELQRLTRDTLEAILEDCFGDYHLTAMRNNRAYRRIYSKIRQATDARVVSELMKQAYASRQNGEMSVKHFIALNTASSNQRERLKAAPISATAYRIIKEILTASPEKLGYLRWAMYRNNCPSHDVHKLTQDEVSLLWSVMKARMASFKEEFLEEPRVRNAIKAILLQMSFKQETPELTEQEIPELIKQLLEDFGLAFLLEPPLDQSQPQKQCSYAPTHQPRMTKGVPTSSAASTVQP